MANKTQRIDERYQIRKGADGTLLVSQDGVKWLTPAAAGIATEAYADEGDADTLALAEAYADTKAQESTQYTDDQIDLAKEELQNYTDDEVAALSSSVDTRLADKADLVGGRVPASQLPAFADTLEVYPTVADFPAVGQSNILYVAEAGNDAYRWNGSGYTRIGEELVLGETVDTAYRGDRGKIAYDHTLLTDNPHQVTKAQVGLSNVDNTADLSKPVSTATQTALNGKANTSHTHTIAQVMGLQAAINGKADTSSLADVATSGDYADLINTPAPIDISGKVNKSGDTMSGALAMGANKITGLAAGTAATDAVNKTQMETAIAAAGGSSVWGGITGVLSNQTDLQSALDGKEDTIAAGGTTQYYRGDKTWATLTKGSVGLGNVDNTSDATKNSATATLTNKRINSRTSSAASAATLSPTVATYDYYVLTALAADLTINAPAGTPVAGNKLLFSFKDNGTARALTWNAAYAPVGVELPTTTVADKWVYVGAIYNGSTWSVIAVAQEA